MEANELAQMASSYHVTRELAQAIITEIKRLPPTSERTMVMEAKPKENGTDWWIPIVQYLKEPQSQDKRLRWQALKYMLLGAKLHRHTVDGMLLRCSNSNEAILVMAKVHKGICGAHQAGIKMK